MMSSSGPGRFLACKGIDALPLWAQVTLAARIARRMTLGWRDWTDAQREPLLRACDCLLAGARTANWEPSDRAAVSLAVAHATSLRADALAHTMLHAGHAAVAAASAAATMQSDATAAASVHRALRSACSAHMFGELQVRVAVAADADLLAFACSEAQLTRLAPLTPAIFSRLMPAHALTPAFEEPVNLQDLYR